MVLGFFLRQQFHDLLPLRLVGGFRQKPAKALQIFAVNEVLHESLLVGPLPCIQKRNILCPLPDVDNTNNCYITSNCFIEDRPDLCIWNCCGNQAGIARSTAYAAFAGIA